MFDSLHRKLSTDDHLDAADQQQVYDRLSRYRVNRSDINGLIAPFQFYTDSDVRIDIVSDSPSSIEQVTSGRLKTIRLSINPNDDLGGALGLEMKYWLAGKLLIYDNYVVVLARYLKKADLRRQFDIGTISPASKSFLQDTFSELSNDERYARVVKAVEAVSQIIEIETQSASLRRDRHGYNSYLSTLIDGSYAFHRIQEIGFTDIMQLEAAGISNSFWDSIDGLTDSATYGISQLFGNAIGLFESRKGKLYEISAQSRQMIRGDTRLLDIYLEKTPFRLTDQFIPGHWGHVAIWVGDERDIAELKRLGVWQELPRIEAESRRKWGYQGPSFRLLIEQGHGVLEALRSGVELNRLDQFLNIDDMAILRPRNLTDEQKRRYLIRAFSQVGKQYDFNFDVETHREIVCSELAFVVFPDFEWPVEMSVGRYTVSPDHIARLAVGDDPKLSPVLLIHDGRKLPVASNRHNLTVLLQELYDQIQY